MSINYSALRRGGYRQATPPFSLERGGCLAPTLYTLFTVPLAAQVKRL